MKNTHSIFRLNMLAGRLGTNLARSLILALGLSTLADRATIDPTRTQIAMPLSAAPTIDGVIDTAEWNRAGGFASDFWRVRINPDLADGILGGVMGGGTVPADDDDLSFTIYAGYDSQNLYVAVRVRDSILQEDTAAADSGNQNTWMDDSVEVFVDGDNSNAARWAAGQIGGQYVISVNNAYREAEAGNPGYGEAAAWFARTTRTDTGYDAEFRISLATLGNPRPGDIIGFTVAVNDDDDGGDNERQVVWVGTAHAPVSYGNLRINGLSYTAPAANPVVIDGTINPTEYPGAAEITVNTANAIYDLTSGDDTWEVTDHGFTARVVHDAEAIYVAVNVTDNQIVTDTAAAGSEDGNTWEDDSVEIFFDPNNSKNTGRGTEQFEGQYVFTANGAWRDNEANNPTFGANGDWFAATTRTATGFAIEFKVKKSALLNPENGASIGFHIAVNDDDGGTPAPKTQYGWSGYAHAEFTYGTLTLGGATAPVNVLPNIAIAAPANSANFDAPATISVTADASDADGTVSKVEFFAGTNLIGTATASPYSINWSNVPAGFYSLTAKATDNSGGTRTSAAVSIGVIPAGANKFVLVDAFETAALAPLNGQNGWTAANTTVIADPTRSTNHVASFEGAGGASLSALIPEGRTGTMFFRAYSVSDTTAIDWCAGLSDVPAAGPSRTHPDFEAQICVAGTQTLNTLKVRDGSANANVDVEEFLPRTWYKIWLVVDNAIDQVEVYMQGGNLAEPTKVVWDDFGFSSFVFRNSGLAPVANDLVKFLVLTTTAHTGQFLLDDLYLDQFGKNLNDPVGSLAVLPTVAITSPAAGAAFTTPTNITITADASRTGGSISKVEFFAGTNLIGSDTSAPFSITWNNVAAGGYRLTAKATDNQGSSQISAPVSITVTQSAAAGFQLVEDFQSIPTGDLNGQRGWTATLARVKADPENASNQVASFEGAADGAAHRPVLVPEGSTATLFFRFRAEVDDPNLRDWWAGLSDVQVSGIGAFGDFETQVGLTGNFAPLRVRDGVIANNVDVDEFLPRTWYKIWTVIDNAADTYEVYVQGGSRTQQTQVDLDSTGATSFVFRNSGAATAANDLVRFLVKSGSGARPGPVLLDDIYLATGKLLTDPSSSPVPQLRITGITRDLASGNFTLQWQGGEPQFQVEKAATITGQFQPLGTVQAGRTFTDAGVLRSTAAGFYRVRQVSGGAGDCTTAAAGAGFLNTAFAKQTGSFTVQFDATPAAAPIDSVIGLSSGSKTAFNGFAVLARFNVDGRIDARNAGAYTAANVIPYSANVKYSFRIVINVPAHTYSVYVTPAGGTEQTVGTDFAFRTEQNTVTELNNWAVTVASTTGSTTVCNFRLQ
jgi:hypothetical protein